MESKDDVDYIRTVFCYSKKEDDHQKNQKEVRKKRREKRKLNISMIENHPLNIGDAPNGTVDAYSNHETLTHDTSDAADSNNETLTHDTSFRCLLQSRDPHMWCWSTDKHN